MQPSSPPSRNQLMALFGRNKRAKHYMIIVNRMHHVGSTTKTSHSACSCCGLDTLGGRNPRDEESWYSIHDQYNYKIPIKSSRWCLSSFIVYYEYNYKLVYQVLELLVSFIVHVSSHFAFCTFISLFTWPFRSGWPHTVHQKQSYKKQKNRYLHNKT